ncbi:hypothetical protein ACFXTO_015563 [Malus domestica]
MRRRNANCMKDGWFYTGDVDVMNPDGYLEIKERSNDIIINGGENMSSVEGESVLYANSAVNEAAVVARPDEFWVMQKEVEDDGTEFGSVIMNTTMDSKKSNRIRDIVRLRQILKKWRKITNSSNAIFGTTTATTATSSSKNIKEIITRQDTGGKVEKDTLKARAQSAKTATKSRAEVIAIKEDDDSCDAHQRLRRLPNY